MPQAIRVALFLMGEPVAALRANDPVLFKRWLSGGVQDQEQPVVEELLLAMTVTRIPSRSLPMAICLVGNHIKKLIT